MDKKAKKLEINTLRSNKLKAAVAKEKKSCPNCASKSEAPSPIKDMMQKLGMLGIPGIGDAGCSHGQDAPKAVVMKVVKIGEPDLGQKKVLEKDSRVTEAQHHMSPFVKRCVAAITKGKPGSREDESSAFAKCVSTKNKSDKDLDKNAEQRPGMESRTKQFEKSLDKVRKHHDHDN